MKIPCLSSNAEDGSKRKPTAVKDYEVEQDFKVAEFESENVKDDYDDIFTKTEVRNYNLIWSLISPKTIRYAIFGVTWQPVLVFLILYYAFQIPYQLELFSTCQRLDEASDVENAEDVAACNRAWHDWVTSMREDEATATKYITFVLGFYVGQVIKRWWDQVKDIPDIDSVTNCLAGFVQLEFKDEDEKKRQQAADDALRLKKKIVRYCLLSWTMCLATISPPLKSKFSKADKFVEKKLLKNRELKALQGNNELSWKDQWWIPITWAICLVNSNHNKSQGCELKEQKGLIGELNKFQSKLHKVSIYQNNPLPLMYGQALIFAIYTYILLSVFSSQYLDLHHSATVIFFSIPWFQIIKIILIYAWLQVANIVRNPFGSDKHYDINLEQALDHNIWKASLSIMHLDRPIYTVAG